MRRLLAYSPALLVLGFGVVLLAGAASRTLGLVVLGSVGLLVFDEVLERTLDGRLRATLQRIEAGLGWRAFFRQLLIVVFVLRVGEISGAAQTLLVLVVIGRHGALVAFLGLRTLLSRRRLRRCETRNLGVVGDVLPAAEPAEWLRNYGNRLVIGTDALVSIALVIAYFGGSYNWVAPAATAAFVLSCAAPAILLPYLWAIRHMPQGESLLTAAQDAVLRLRPTIILHFSGGMDSVYQVNMWLETMERLDHSVLVLLRERRYLDRLAPTRLPVLCLPFSTDLMNFQIPGARIALYVANVGKNIHLLREPALKSAFIGHGDSDKTASFNPFTKVYDEVWVAGDAGRQRYLRAQVGVRDEQIVLVGRPQLDAIQPPLPRPEGTPFTVLYAPTWEGWTDDLCQSSLIPMGLEMVRELVNTASVRVLFKPHPLTGTVDRHGHVVCQQIAELLAASGPEHEYVDGARPLYDCFDESDALISDISSVVSDYLYSDKPYFVSNNAGLTDERFRTENPSAGAAYLIAPGAAGLLEGLAEARGTDPMRARRREVRTYLLGDPDSNAMDLFRDAVNQLVDQANAHPGRVDGTRVEDDALLEEMASAGSSGSDDV